MERTALDRRSFLALTGVSAGAVALGVAAPERAMAATTAPDGVFGLGVASGAPTPDGVVLWTRLAPEPLAPDGHGGMRLRPTAVRWEVAEDELFRRPVRRGTAVASPELAHSVHPQVRGLRPGREYFYRFRVGAQLSPVGRTRTAPEPGAVPARMSIATASCQAWYEGHYSAYRHMAAQDLDLVVFLGDYIYEYGLGAGVVVRQGAPALGSEHAAEIETLAQYRLRYGLFKSDPHLQAAHAAAPWLVTWDDHEVQNNYADEYSGYGIPPELFVYRRAAAYRAHYENLPLPVAALPVGPDGTVHSATDWGRLARVELLDVRQHRDAPPNTPEEQADPARTMLGAAQEQWLHGALRTSRAAWDVIGSGVVVTPVGERFVDQWDGYPAARQRLLKAMAGAANPVVVSGDIHRHYAAEVPSDPVDPTSAPAAVELVTSSIASGRDGAQHDGPEDEWMEAPNARLWDGRRGYVRLDLTPEQLVSEFVVVPYIQADDRAQGVVAARFVTEAGRPTLEREV